MEHRDPTDINDFLIIDKKVIIEKILLNYNMKFS